MLENCKNFTLNFASVPTHCNSELADFRWHVTGVIDAMDAIRTRLHGTAGHAVGSYTTISSIVSASDVASSGMWHWGTCPPSRSLRMHANFAAVQTMAVLIFLPS